MTAKGKPKEGTPAWERSLRNDPNFVRETIRSLTARASAGEPGAAEQLNKWLNDCPQFKSEVQALCDLMAKTEALWVNATSFGDKLAEQAAREEAAAMRSKLLPTDATILDKVLASAVVVAYLAHARAALRAAGTTDIPALQTARERCLSEAQKRLMSAVKNFQLISGKKSRGMRTPLKLFDAAQPAAS